jgi:hypothetical protein
VVVRLISLAALNLLVMCMLLTGCQSATEARAPTASIAPPGTSGVMEDTTADASRDNATTTPVPTVMRTPPPTATHTQAATYTPSPIPTRTTAPTIAPTETPTSTPTLLHPVIVIDEPFDADNWGCVGQDGVETVGKGQLVVYGPPDDPDVYAAYSIRLQPEVAVPEDATLEFVFDHFPRFSGPWFRTPNEDFFLIVEQDGNVGLLRPSEQAAPWDNLGRIRKKPDGAVDLRLVFQGDELQVWGNDQLVASRTAAAFAAPVTLMGFRIGEEANFAIERLTMRTTQSVADQIPPTEVPVPALDQEAAIELGFAQMDSCSDESGKYVMASLDDGFVYCIPKGGVIGWVDGSINIQGYEYPVQVVRYSEANFVHILNSNLGQDMSDEETYSLMYGTPPPPQEGVCMPLAVDDFENPFLTLLAEGHNQTVFYRVEDGEYQIDLRQPQMSAWVGGRIPVSMPDDYAITVDARWEEQDQEPASAVGVIFSVQENQPPFDSLIFYVYGDGRYAVHKQRDSVVCDGVAPNFQAFPDSNQLGVVRQGAMIRLYLNGEQLAELSEPEWADQRGFGLSAISGDVTPLKVAFDNLAVLPPGCWP